MNNISAFEKKDIFVKNDKLLLRRTIEEDKAGYLQLHREVSAKFVAKDKKFAQFLWDSRAEDGEVNISIILKEKNEYLGNVVIRRFESKTPEIGIDVLKKWRRKGIAYQSLSLVIKRLFCKRDIDYILVRVYSDNIASLGLVHKLGAVKIGKELSEMERLLNNLKQSHPEIYEQAVSAEMVDKAKSNHIIRYKIVRIPIIKG